MVYGESSPSSQTIAAATSSARPGRPTGIVAASRAARSGWPPLAWISVSTMPGRTALTRIPSVATSRASPSVKVSTAPLLAA